MTFLYFDLGNVLLQFSHERACRQLADALQARPDDVRRWVFDSGLEEQYERGELSTDDFFEQLCAAAGRRPDKEALLNAASDIFQLNAATEEIVRELAAAGRPLGILSNTCDAHWQFVRRRFPVLAECFGLYALSFELGALKPDPRIYDQAAALAAVEPADVFFVDDRAENVAAARRAAYDSVQFHSPAQLRRDLHQRGLI